LKTLTFALLAALAAVGASPAAAATNLIVNGDFETPAAPSKGFTIFGGGSHGLTGWTVLGPASNAVALLANDYTEPNVAFESEHGGSALDLSGGGNTGPTAGVSQDVATEIGKAYVLKFWLGNADGNNNYTLPSTLSLAFNDAPATAFTNANITRRGVNWQEVTVAFRATTSTTSIIFQNATPRGDAFTGLDNVSLTAGVPEPATWTMMIAGFGFAGAALRRRVRTANVA
jgi:hypothetical protein